MELGRFELIEKELISLIDKGDKMLMSMAYIHDAFDSEDRQKFIETIGKPVNIEYLYQPWYTEASEVIKKLIPDRYEDFRILYKDYKRGKSDITYINYTMEDYLHGLEIKQHGVVIVNPKAAITKLRIQVDILRSAKVKLKSSLFNINELLKADLFDSELDTSEELLKKGFNRAAGSIVGVVLEKHLRDVCENHNLKTVKAKPTMSDYYTLLKNNNVVDTPTWRYLQFLADIRNKCDHAGEEPAKDEIVDLLNGTKKTIKTLF